MATIEQRLNALATAIGADVRALRIADGDLTSLSTRAKANLVAAINEVYAIAQAGTGVIDDLAAANATTKTYSVQKIGQSITDAISALRDELRAGAGEALDTFAEVAAQLAADETVATALATAVANRVRFDAAQVLTTDQQATARNNIAAASQEGLTAVSDYAVATQDQLVALSDSLGNVGVDLAGVYTAARDAA